MYKDPAGTSQRQHYKSITEAGENRQWYNDVRRKFLVRT
jgi:hypothetical protein